MAGYIESDALMGGELSVFQRINCSKCFKMMLRDNQLLIWPQMTTGYEKELVHSNVFVFGVSSVNLMSPEF